MKNAAIPEKPFAAIAISVTVIYAVVMVSVSPSF